MSVVVRGGGGVKGVVEMTQNNLLEPFKTLEIHHALYFYLQVWVLSVNQPYLHPNPYY